MTVNRNEFEDLIGEFPAEEVSTNDQSEEDSKNPEEDPEGDSEDSLDIDNSDNDSSDESEGDEEDGEDLEAEDGDSDASAEDDEEKEGDKEEGEEKELTEVERLKEQNRLLMEQLNGAIKEPEAPASEEKEEEDPLAGIDPEELLDDPDKFKSFLSDYAKKVREEAIKQNEAIVSSQVQQQLAVNKLVSNFYVDNPQLAGVKKYIGMVAKEISSENPDKSYEDVLKETAEKAYKNLGIQKNAIKPNRKKPSFAKAGSKAPRTTRKAKNETEEQIDAILNLEF